MGRAPTRLRGAKRGRARPHAEQLHEFLRPPAGSWWLPENWTFIDEVPKTSVGKLDKKRLRALHTNGALDVVRLRPSSALDST